jgi:hypothetical protein
LNAALIGTIQTTSSGEEWKRADKMPRSRRRWLQFSMRTMLVVVSVTCVLLALWGVPAERQRRAVAAIEALGGFVQYVANEGKSESIPVAFLRQWLPQSYFDGVEAVSLYPAKFTDADLVHLKWLPGLQRLYLAETQVTDAGLAHLRGLIDLQRLDLHNTQITDAGLVHLKGLTGLQVLELRGTQVTDDGLAQLHELKDSAALDLSGIQVTDARLAELRKALPGCNIIRGP